MPTPITLTRLLKMNLALESRLRLTFSEPDTAAWLSHPHSLPFITSAVARNGVV
jgi:hypothetical protein